jgi:hypothetical protein
MIPSRNFRVSGLTLRSSTHLEVEKGVDIEYFNVDI